MCMILFSKCNNAQYMCCGMLHCTTCQGVMYNRWHHNSAHIEQAPSHVFWQCALSCTFQCMLPQRTSVTKPLMFPAYEGDQPKVFVKSKLSLQFQIKCGKIKKTLVRFFYCCLTWRNSLSLFAQLTIVTGIFLHYSDHLIYLFDM